MKISKNIKATSIVEAMVVLIVIVSWVVWMYDLLIKSNNLVSWEENKIQAIQIARQWIEAFTNIRDTNWLIFSSDYDNCWNVFNYESLCIWDNSDDYDIKENNNYKIYIDSDGRWELTNTGLFSPNTYTNVNYRDFYKVWLNNWMYTQSWITEKLTSTYTREIKVNYLKEDLTDWIESDPMIEVTAIVQWVDNSSSAPHKIEIKQILSNWKWQK